MRRLLLLLGLILIIIALAGIFLRSRAHQVRLFGELLVRSLPEVRDDYAGRSCRYFSERELQRDYFIALVTGYCKPLAPDFATRREFLCAVGLNCACPSGRDAAMECALGGSLTWQGCRDFDDKVIEYCHQTASQIKPEAGHVAADWSCFPQGSEIAIGNQTYRVTDRGSAIHGRRFDIWFDNCQAATRALGLYRVKIN